MTPIKLKMAAFGAYIKPVTLDFQSGLQGAKIFLIHGATGSGKTTILDAICYALYGETSGKARDARDMRSKGISDDILTEVEFEFALGDKIYRVEREIIYNSKKKDNKYQTRARLFCNGTPIETKDRAVKNKIIELLGFDAEQFRQVVMLPQGDFKKFLSADAKERQELLNVIFDSTPYKMVEDALKERAKQSVDKKNRLETRCNDLKRQLEGVESDSMPNIAEKFELAQKKSAELKKISDKAQVQLSDGKILVEKFAELQKKTSELKNAQIQLAEIEKMFAATQSEYQKREGQESQRKELDKKIRELNEIQATINDLVGKNYSLKMSKNKLAIAQADFDKYYGLARQYEDLLADLESKKTKLVGADVEFEKTAQILKDAKNKAKLLREIEQCEKILIMEQEKLVVVEKNLTAAQIELERLQIVDNAARLVSKLKEGEPCPVCGSREHPAITEAAIPTVFEIQNVEKNVARLNKEQNQQIKTVQKAESELSSKKEQLIEYKNISDVASAQEKFDLAQKKKTELARYQQRIEKGNDLIKKNKTQLDNASNKKNAAENEVAKLEGAILEAKKKIPENYSTNSEQLDADLAVAQKNFSELDTAWKLAQKNFQEAREKKSARAATLSVAKKNFKVLQTELSDKTPPDIEFLAEKATEARENYNKVIREAASLGTMLNALKKYSVELEKVQKELEEAKKIAETWQKLSNVANPSLSKGESELRISFERYFLSTMFNEVVVEANNRLKKMSNGRYQFQMRDAGKRSNSAAGLNLEIFDEHNGSARPVETLSGGESFLASLSLALGLTSTVRNKIGGIRLDTIFIDEGFGTLDNEALDFAISTIIEQSGGRLIGIISHVEELKNQIPVRLEVSKAKVGSTAKFVSAY